MGRFFKLLYFVSPLFAAVLAHELGHIIGGLLVGGRIGKINLDPERGRSSVSILADWTPKKIRIARMAAPVFCLFSAIAECLGFYAILAMGKEMTLIGQILGPYLLICSLITLLKATEFD